jgi:general secretion pathway protein D
MTWDPLRSAQSRALVLLVVLASASMPLAAQNETQETRPQPFRYSIAADGIQLEQLVKDAESNTGKTFVYSDTAATYVKNKIVKMLGTAQVAPTPQQIFSFFQGILISQNLAITPLGDERNGIFLIETVDSPRQLKQRAPFVHEANLKDYRHEIGTVIMTSIQLKHIKVDNVRNAVSQILTNRNVEFTMDVLSANALIVVGFAPSVYALSQVIAAMDVPQVEATLKFELIGLAEAVAEELVPIIETLIKGDGATPQRPRPAGGEGGFGGAEKPEPKIIADPRTNSIVVYAVESDMNKIKYLVSALDAAVKEPESNIRVYMLKNTNAEDLVEVLQEIIGTGTSGRGTRPGSSIRGATGQGPVSTVGPSQQELKIVADKNNNALLITASKTRYAELLPIIIELDRRRPQVLVQAAIAELSDSDARDIGVEIAALEGGDGNRLGAVTGFGLSTIQTTGTAPDLSLIRIPFLTPGAGSGAAGTVFSPSGGVFGIFNELNVPIFVALLQRTTKSNLVSMPSVLTNDNEQSKITFSRNVATQTFQTTVAGTDNTSFGGYQEAKIELVISPHISNDNYVRMEVELTVEAFVGTQINPTIPPDKTSRKLVGSVTVRSGKTVVIGGLIQDNQTTRVSQVPYLGDIPLVGELFKRTEKLNEKDTLYVFITPTIFTGFDELEEVSYDKKLEIHKLCGQIKIIDPNFREIKLDDRHVRIDCIEESGTLDIPHYAPVIPCGDCGPEPAPRPVDGVPVRPQRMPQETYVDPAAIPRPASRVTR